MIIFDLNVILLRKGPNETEQKKADNLHLTEQFFGHVNFLGGVNSGSFLENWRKATSF